MEFREGRRVREGRDLSRSFGAAVVSGRRLGLAAVGAVVGLAATGCTANEAFLFDFPEPATAEGPMVQSLWTGSWIAAWAVGALTWGLMIWAVIAYRRRHSGEVPAQTRYHLPIELLYTVLPLIMILGLFWFTARDQSEILTLDNDQDQTVNVVGFRWSWGFNYVDENVYDVGAAYSDNSPGEPPTLYLPVGEKVKFELNSPDVIHSFWVPAFLFKMDVIPGKTNAFELTPDRLGTYAGKCAELCGVAHARMLFQVKVVERAEFDAKMEELRERGQTGQLDNKRFNDEGQRPGERII